MSNHLISYKWAQPKGWATLSDGIVSSGCNAVLSKLLHVDSSCSLLKWKSQVVSPALFLFCGKTFPTGFMPQLIVFDPDIKWSSWKQTGLPRWLCGKESVRQRRRLGFNPWVGKIPWRRAWQPTPVFLPGESHGQRSLVGYSPSIGSQRVRHN